MGLETFYWMQFGLQFFVWENHVGLHKFQIALEQSDTGSCPQK